jgi:cytochrome P450
MFSELVPIKSFQKSYESLVNWRQYMKELMAMKIEEARAGEKSAGMDILGALVKSSYGKGKEVDEEMLEKEQTGQAILSDSDILGNAFVMIVAGHETTANSIHFSLVQLAINPRFQRMAQKEVQNIFGNAEPETWDYDSTINTLLGGILGAILNEELRLMPPVIAIPKSVPDNTDQELVVGGKKYMVPAGTRISLNAIGLSRNPKYWPAQESKISKKDDDLDEFIPERWLVNDHKGGPDDSDHDEDEFGGFTGNNSSAKLFHPVRGAFLPFSDGPRSCIGRRLAQVKVMAVLATIFQKYSIELAVDEWATDDEVSRMSQEEKIALYKKAQEKANATLRTATSRITLKLHPGHIPVRVVRKGEERFISLVK